MSDITIKELQDYNDTQRNIIENQQAEIERLRNNETQALKALADTDDGCRKRFAEYRVEIERLRGLLLEVWNWSIGGPTGVSSDLFERVREALGE